MSHRKIIFAIVYDGALEDLGQEGRRRTLAAMRDDKVRRRTRQRTHSREHRLAQFEPAPEDLCPGRLGDFPRAGRSRNSDQLKCSEHLSRRSGAVRELLHQETARPPVAARQLERQSSELGGKRLVDKQNLHRSINAPWMPVGLTCLRVREATLRENSAP